MRKTKPHAPDRFALYDYTKADMDEYHQHVYDSFGETDWQIIMCSFIDTVRRKCESDAEIKDLIDDFIYNMIQEHYNT